MKPERVWLRAADGTVFSVLESPVWGWLDATGQAWSPGPGEAWWRDGSSERAVEVAGPGGEA